MCNLGNLGVKIEKKEEKKKKKKKVHFLTFRRTLPHGLVYYSVSPFSQDSICSRLVPTTLHCVAQLLPNTCTCGRLHTSIRDLLTYLRSG